MNVYRKNRIKMVINISDTLISTYLNALILRYFILSEYLE